MDQIQLDPKTGMPYAMHGTNGLALASLILGILGIIGCCCCPALPLLPLSAVICGHIAISQLRSTPGREGTGMAVAGLILGYTVILIALLYAVAVATSPETRKMMDDIKKHVEEELQKKDNQQSRMTPTLRRPVPVRVPRTDSIHPCGVSTGSAGSCPA